MFLIYIKGEIKMKIECSKLELNVALNAVAKTSASKTTMPILEGVLIEVSNKKMKLTTNDLEMGCEYIINVNEEREGSIVVDLKMFTEIVRKLDGENISIEVENDIFVIKSMGSIYKLSTMNADEYPRLPVFNVDKHITLKQNVFKDLIRKTNFAVSIDENRPIYTGELIKIEDSVLTVVAIDGFRLALKKYMCEKETGDFKAIIPGKVLNEVIKLLSEGEEEITIGVNKNQALFEMENCILTSRIIEGEFLNYSNVIPAEKETKIKLKTKNLLDCFERVALFAKESSEKDKKFPVKMCINMDGVILSCNSQTGDAKEDINAVVEGKQLEIGFNPRYMVEALKTIEDEEITMEFTTSISPAIIKPVAGNAYVYMVLPVKIKQD